MQLFTLHLLKHPGAELFLSVFFLYLKLFSQQFHAVTLNILREVHAFTISPPGGTVV